MDNVARVGIPILSLALFWIWESLHPYFGQAEGRLRHAARNLGLALLNTLVLSLVFSTLVVLLVDQMQARGWGLLNHVGLDPWGKWIAAFLMLDGTMYAWHRANHRIPFLWRFHRVHHSDPHMDVTTATRFHLGEHTGAFVVRCALVVLGGFDVMHLVVYDLSLIVMTHFHHADISLGRLDPLLRLLIVTPDMHKTHHSDRQPETDSNYSVVFSVWDRLGRSHVVSPDPQAIRFGLRAYTAGRWQTLWGMLRTPFAAGEQNPDSKS